MTTPPTSTPWVPMWPMAAPVPAVVNGKWLKGVGGAMVWSDIGVADVAGAEAVANKGVANGYPSLGADGKVPVGQVSADNVIASVKLAANNTLLSLAAGSIPQTYGAIEIDAFLYQSSACTTSERISWGFTPLPGVGTIAYGIWGNPGTGSPGAGQAFAAGSVTLSTFLCHLTARQNTIMAHFHARIQGYAEGRSHLMTFEFESFADFSGTPANDVNHFSGRAIIDNSNVRAQPPITGFQIYGNGSGFGVGSCLQVRGVGAPLPGF